MKYHEISKRSKSVKSETESDLFNEPINPVHKYQNKNELVHKNRPNDSFTNQTDTALAFNSLTQRSGQWLKAFYSGNLLVNTFMNANENIMTVIHTKQLFVDSMIRSHWLDTLYNHNLIWIFSKNQSIQFTKLK